MYNLYSITNGVHSSITSAEIIAMLRPLAASRPAVQRTIANIERMEREGMRYCNEDCDVLSAALMIARGGLHISEDPRYRWDGRCYVAA